MRTVIVLTLILSVFLGGWFLYSDNIPEGTKVTEKPSKLDPSGKVEDERIDSDNVSQSLVAEAEKYVSELSETDSKPLKADTANDFINSKQVITLAEKPKIETTTISDLLASGIDQSSPVTLVKQEDELVYKTPAKILHDAKNNPATIIRIMDEDRVTETSVADLLEQYSIDEIINIPVLEQVENYIVTTPAEISANPELLNQDSIKIIRKPYALESTSISELLMGETDIAADNIYYVRNIQASDADGIWGIIQNGLIDNFASGIAIKRGESIEKYKVAIPENADEILADNTSSFLGRIIQDKTRKSYVYNFENGKMGRNPDLIYPGQELLIISFKSDELIKIYQHFVSNAVN